MATIYNVIVLLVFGVAVLFLPSIPINFAICLVGVIAFVTLARATSLQQDINELKRLHQRSD
jgi:FtsH-binding integral membrane protein